jgi:5'-nucleotidase (lipoprotein e(P4) family)
MRRTLPLVLLSLLGACTARVAPMSPAGPSPELAGMQYLYGSGEGAAISRQAWSALTSYAAGTLGGKDRRGVVLAEDATLAMPRFVPCAGRPPAAVFDVDETVLLNLGFEYDVLARHHSGFDDARWDRWEKTGAAAVAPTPGAKEAIDSLRAMGVTVIFNTNRFAANAVRTARAITGAGLGPAVHGETLFLAGDDATGSHKDGRRQRIAARWCVIAMGGDQLGDFSDLFNAIPNPADRRAAIAAPGIADMWGRGWFVLPNPVYGAALKGDADTIFPADRRWRDPADLSKKEPN